MKHNGNINGSGDTDHSSVVGSFRTFGAHGVLYEVLGVQSDDPDMAEILVVETGEKTRYPLDQLVADPVAH
jgi:hypothetical protein